MPGRFPRQAFSGEGDVSTLKYVVAAFVVGAA